MHAITLSDMKDTKPNNRDDQSFDTHFCNGHWDWDNKKNELKFISNLSREDEKKHYVPTYVVSPIEFNDEMDIIEQQRFKRRIQRKSEGENDIVTLQDVKDVVLFTAPKTLLSQKIIDVLHSPTTERFLRALILYCQYFIQIAEIMGQRTIERQTKIPTPKSVAIENTFRENLSDIRLLVSKEYCAMVTGSDDFHKFHHTDKSGRKRSGSVRWEAMVFEPLIKLSVQIVWVALTRKHFQLIEFEINRLFRTKKFNTVANKKKRESLPKLTSVEKYTLLGDCQRKTTLLNMHSPLFNELYCDRVFDFQLLGLDVIDQGKDDRRLHLQHYLVDKESTFDGRGISLGIIGLQRGRFDIMLRELHISDSKRDSWNKNLALAQRKSRSTTVQSQSSCFETNLDPSTDRNQLSSSERRSKSRSFTKIQSESSVTSIRCSSLERSSSKIHSPSNVIPLKSDMFLGTKSLPFRKICIPQRKKEPPSVKFPRGVRHRIIIDNIQHRKWLAWISSKKGSNIKK